MRLLCPHCSQSIAIVDSEAGKQVNCPLCGQSFTAPELYSVSNPDPPPALTVPTPITPVVAPPAPPPTPSPVPKTVPLPPPPRLDGYARVFSVSLHPATMQWLAPIGLTLALILTLFKWNGSFPAGYAAYTQNAWQALFATMSTDPVAEKLMGMEQSIKDRLNSSWWLLPYLIFLVLAVVLAWAHHLVSRGRIQLPVLLQGIWNIRLALLAALAGIVLFLLLAQVVGGFSLEHAVSNMVSQQFAEDSKLAKTPEEIQVVQMKVAQEFGRFQIIDTTWLWLAILMHLLALVGIAAETAIHERGNRPPPRVGIFW